MGEINRQVKHGKEVRDRTGETDGAIRETNTRVEIEKEEGRKRKEIENCHRNRLL